MVSPQPTPAAGVQASRQRRRIWLALLAGFGGVLILLVAVGMDAVFVLGRLHTSGTEMRQRIQHRTRILEQIRSQIYLSGTYVRDYLLAPEPSESAAQRGRLQALQRSTETALREYERELAPRRADQFSQA